MPAVTFCRLVSPAHAEEENKAGAAGPPQEALGGCSGSSAQAEDGKGISGSHCLTCLMAVPCPTTLLCSLGVEQTRSREEELLARRQLHCWLGRAGWDVPGQGCRTVPVGSQPSSGPQCLTPGAGGKSRLAPAPACSSALFSLWNPLLLV